MTAQILTQARLQELLHYDSFTGIFTWKKATSNRRATGKVAGSKNSRGYVEIGIDRKVYPAHRLAWLYVYGAFPAQGVDHITGKQHGNAIANLRPADHSENGQNRDKQSNNTSGYKGVSWSKKVNKWVVQMTHKGVHFNLGYFSDIKAAHEAYLNAAKNIFTHNEQIKGLTK